MPYGFLQGGGLWSCPQSLCWEEGLRRRQLQIASVQHSVSARRPLPPCPACLPSPPPRYHPPLPAQNSEGTALGPFDCWLLLRGIKTMALRMERQAENAGKLAAWLAQHPMVQRVNYPGLEGHPGRDVHFRQVRAARARGRGCRAGDWDRGEGDQGSRG